MAEDYAQCSTLVLSVSKHGNLQSEIQSVTKFVRELQNLPT